MNKQYYPLHYDFNHPLEFYHNPFGARRPIPHEHDKNDKVRIDCYDCSAGYLQDKISACNGIAIVRELDENCNSRLILSSTINEFGMYSAGEGIDKNLLEYSSTISVSGFDNYYTKEEVSSNYATKLTVQRTNYDLSLLYNSADKYFYPTYDIVHDKSAYWDGLNDVPELIEDISADVNYLGNMSGRWENTYGFVYQNSGEIMSATKDYVSRAYFFQEFIPSYNEFVRNHNKQIDMLQHELQQAYKLIYDLSGKLENNGD